ncbi:polyprenol phosphomannose-dependent alpha 1,6 mannosyltransferase MptB [Frankia canadensis]|nr:polyprenol phosphomannose-dependent alpha 1,6 mannosyltransferase MptB [Frankia canadensis]
MWTPPEVVLIGAAGFVGVVLVVATGGRLARQSLASPPTSWLGLLNPVNLTESSGLPALLVGGVALTLLAWLRAGMRAHRGILSPRQAVGLLAVWSIPVCLGPPILSLDVYSYAAQGMLLATGFDPYHAAPTALAAGSPQLAAVDPLWRSANAPYGPLAVTLFRLAHLVAGGSLIGVIVLLRLLALAGVVLIAACAVAGAPRHRRADALVLAALNPIVLFQLLGAAHLEAIMMGLVVAGLLAVQRGRAVTGLVLLTAAAAIKWPAVLAVAAAIAWRAGAPSRPSCEDARNASRGDGHGGGELAAGWRRRAPARVAGAARDAIVAGAAFAGLAALVPDGLGWVRTATTPATVLTGYTPTSIAADLLGWGAGLLDLDPSPAGILTFTQHAGLAATGAVCLWTLATIRARPLTASAGAMLLALAALGPVLHPWYLTWGLVPLAVRPGGPARMAVLAIASAGSFLGLQHCSLLVADHPAALRWLREHGGLVALAGYVAAAALCAAVSRGAAVTASRRAAVAASRRA